MYVLYLTVILFAGTLFSGFLDLAGINLSNLHYHTTKVNPHNLDSNDPST